MPEPTVLPLPMPTPKPATARRPRNLAMALVDAFGERIRRGVLRPGDRLPVEAAIVAEFGVSRTVVREALSMLQAQRLVQTKHGIGTFVIGPADDAAGFRVTADQLATLHDVIAMLELRIAVESEAASLAAVRRLPQNLAQMRQALDAVSAAMEAGQDAVELDFSFHLEIGRATQNAHFANLMVALGQNIIPRVRLGTGAIPQDQINWDYLRRVQAEHESIFDAIAAADPEAARTTMRMHLVNSRERRRRAAEQVRPAAAAP